ncbi:MAG: hypothetical protein NPIRA01_05930 [Nitrospirales bacterium]|nr:MAG: hypothetical protein NPIRA01_05930 [Nitrospirales bacterium]
MNKQSLQRIFKDILICPVGHAHSAMKHKWFLAIIVAGYLGFSVLAISAQTGAPGWLETAVPSITVHVNLQHPRASNTHTGLDKQLPLKSVKPALKIAIQNRKKGLGTKILIYPGIYRENLSLMFQESSEGLSPIMLIAKENGKSVISGSDIWTDWHQDSSDTLSHTWPHNWGMRPVPEGWPSRLNISEIVRRREMIFVNGTPLNQVLSVSELRPSSFFVDEQNHKVYIKLSKEMPASQVTIEVAVRSALLRVSRIENFVMKGLRFQHDTTGLQGGAVSIMSSRNVLIEDCEFIFNNWSGLSLARVKNITTRRNVLNYNGAMGWGGIWIKNLSSVDDETSYNNWRGALGGFSRWSIAGVKHMHVHNATYEGQKAIGNATRGFWLDTDNSGIEVKDACWCKNLTDGVFLELSQGPISIRNSTICDNGDYGVVANSSSSVTIEENTITNNGKSQIFITGSVQRKSKNWESNDEMLVKTKDWTIANNTFQSQKSALLSTPEWKHFLGSLHAANNVWLEGSAKEVFSIGKTQMSMGTWQDKTRIKFIKKNHGINAQRTKRKACP